MSVIFADGNAEASVEIQYLLVLHNPASRPQALVDTIACDLLRFGSKAVARIALVVGWIFSILQIWDRLAIETSRWTCRRDTTREPDQAAYPERGPGTVAILTDRRPDLAFVDQG